MLVVAMLATPAAIASALTFEWKLPSAGLDFIHHGDGTLSLSFPPANIWPFHETATSPWIGEPGEPALPVRRAAYALADGTDRAAVTVVDAVFETLNLTAVLAPAQRKFRCGNEAATPRLLSAYQSAAFGAPDRQLASLSAPATLRDVTYQVLTLAPVEYDYARGEVRVLTSATVQLTGVAEPGGDLATRPPKAVVPAFAELYRASFANADGLALEPSRQATALLIHADHLEAEAITLKAHKESVQGVPTTMVTASKAGKTSAAVSRFVKQAFETSSFAHLVLLGSIEDIPSPVGKYSKASCDNCYAFITEDYAVDFFVSRITAAAAAAQIDKLQRYETAVGQDSFVSTAWGIASRQTDQKFPTPSHPVDCTRVKKYRETLTGWNYKSDTVECDPFATTKFGRDELINAFNSGHSLLNYLGHGAGHYWVMTGFDIDDAHALTNQYTNPVILDGSCNCGDFGHTTSPFKKGEQKCLAEALMEGNADVPGSGAVAMFSSAPTAQWVPPADMQTGALAALTGDKVTKLGPMIAAGIQYMLTQWPNKDGWYTIEGYNLLGDSMMALNNLPLKRNAAGSVA